MEEKFELIWRVESGDLMTNIEKVKEDIEVLIEPFKDYVVEDETMVDDAKKARAKLNKIEKIINDEKKKIKNEILAPYEEMETVAKEAIGIIKKASQGIDKQIKMYEEMWKQDKLDEIKEFFDTLNFNLVTLEDLMSPSWLNKTTTAKQWQSELKSKVLDIKSDIDSLPEVDDIIVEYLNNGFDKEKAISRYEAKMEFKRERQESQSKTSFIYTVEVNGIEESEVFEALCKEYEFKIKEKV